MPIIDIIQPKAATGKFKSIYDDFIKSRGKIAELHKIQKSFKESAKRNDITPKD